MNVLLAPYRAVNRLRRALYRAGMLRPQRLPKPVISIGNIAAGGTGKTPAVIAVAKFLEANGYRVAVLTRGHGRGAGDQYGDEPRVIKQYIKGDVIVGVNRYESGSRVPADVYLLDDGFQHLQLHRDIDLVIDAPARYYREGRSALRDADIVIPRRLRMIVPNDARGKRLFAFSGLADNEQFFDSLRAEGLEVIGTRGFRDHHRYSAADLDSIAAAARAAGAEAIVTTEKDAVKIERRDMIPIPAEFVIEPAVLDRLLAMIRT